MSDKKNLELVYSDKDVEVKQETFTESKITIKNFEESYNAVKLLVKNFNNNLNYYLGSSYLEAQVRSDFIDPLFEALGWDVNHKEQHNPYKQEVKIEKSQIQEGKGGKKFADYAFFINPDFKNPMFFVEAKRPSIVLEDNHDYYLQTHKYGWNAQVPISILTDFEEFIIIDCRSKPNIKYSSNTAIRKYKYTDFTDIDKFKEIYYLFSKEAVIENSISNFVKTQIPELKSKSRQLKLFGGGYKAVDDDFLDYIDSLRLDLAIGFVSKNKEISSEELTEATQKTIDRLIFIRFLEDKQIEYDDHIYNIKKWDDFIILSKFFDTKYNGIVFKPSIIDNSDFKGIEDSIFVDLCIDISSKESPYNFNSIPIHIIGNIYERFLGKIVSVNNGKVSIELKPEVRKAGGVFYTPKYIVDYLVNNSVGELIKGKIPKEIDEMSFADISCGSGSFLIGVYEKLIDYHKEYYYNKLKDKVKLTKNSDDLGNVEFRDGHWVITLKRKQEILLNNVFGVDIDNQSVEVTQLSMFLKLLEDESVGTTSNLPHQKTLFTKVLPNLTNNIKCGNSLVSWDVSSNMGSLTMEEEMSINPFDYKSSFPTVFPKGFDAIVGNPPYVKEGKIDKKIMEYIKNSYLAPYYQGKMDIWYFFVSNGLDLLKDDGLLAYIAPNNWVTNAGASKLRNKVIKDSQIVEMVDFGSYMVFDDASIQTMNFILKKDNLKDSYKFLYSKLENENNLETNAISLLKQETAPNNKILYPKLKRTDFIDKYILFGNKDVKNVLNKIIKNSNFNLDTKEMTNGIHPHHSSISKKMVQKGLTKYPIGTGVFGLSLDELNKLKLSSIEKKLIKPFFSNTEHLVQYTITSKETEYIIYTDSSFKDISKMDNYPVLKEHLDNFTNIITSDNKPYGLHRARKESFFLGSKIISVRKCQSPTFIYDNEDNYFSAAFYIIDSKRINLKYLTALLNSSVVKFWLKNKGKMQGNIFQVDKGPLLDIPIVKSKNKLVIKKLSKLVDDIIVAKKNIINATTQKEKDFLAHKIESIENQIDIEVYNIYGLNSVDIDIIKDAIRD